MRILFIIPQNFQLMPISNSIIDVFQSLNYELDIIKMNVFYLNCTYFQRKLYKLGVTHSENKYNLKLITALEEKCRQFNPNVIMILGGEQVPVAVQEYLTRYPTILWLWDSIRRGGTIGHFINFVTEIFCFEYEDLALLSDKNNIHYLPLGANDKIYCPAEVERDLDICFVGLASKLRLKVLENVCAKAVQRNWTMKIGGILYNDKHFWKRYIFKNRYSHLAKFVDNRIFTPEEVAALYRRSKICLNINTVGHKSLSPRTFEICATKSFQLMNAGQESHGLMNLDTDLAIYNDIDDLLTKIEFYLDNENLREKIALAGYNSVMKNCTITKSVERLIAESQVLRGNYD